MNPVRLTYYDSVPVHDLLMRGRFLARNYLSKDELQLGLSYLKSASSRGSLEAAEALIEVCENDILNIPGYDHLVRETAYRAVLNCENATGGIPFLEKLVRYGSHEETLTALSILRKKEPGPDAACTRTRILIAEYKLTNNDPYEMLAACRNNLDSYPVYKFYFRFFFPWPKNKKNFDFITPEDARILFSDIYKRNVDPDPLLYMIRNSISPYRDQILDEYQRSIAERFAKSAELEKLFEVSREMLQTVLAGQIAEISKNESKEEE